jgi:hypothetical protein
MIRPLNKWEITLGMSCHVCEGLATHRDSETNDNPPSYCNAHAFQQGMLRGGIVKPNLWNDTRTARSCWL